MSVEAPTRDPQEEMIESGGGVRIFLRSWRPAGRPRAVVVICHGVNSHSGQFFWVADRIVDDGYAVYALDLRGRGRSEGERFYVESVDEYVADLSAAIRLAKSREGGLPVFLLGHSAGGVTSCIYTLGNQAELAGFICESFAFEVPAPDIALAIIKGISHIVPHTHVLTLKNEDFSRDPAVVRSMNEDPLIANESQPSATVAALVRADARIRAEASRITLPVLIMHGTADKATKPSGSQFFHDHVGSADKTLKLYEGYFHDPLNDLGKERVIADILDWIDRRLPVA